MSSFAVCLNAVLPLFLVMGLGYIAQKKKRSNVLAAKKNPFALKYSVCS